MRPLRAIRVALLVLALALLGGNVWAAPAGSVGGSVDTNKGVSGSADGEGGGFQLPELVVAGNGISFLAPFQIGAVGYLPKARLAFQYDRQIKNPHWVYLGVGLLLDRGNWKNFRMDECGLDASMGGCDRGTVAGFDIYAGYAHKWYIEKRPWLVPFVRGGIGFNWWRYPRLSGPGARNQERIRSWGLTLRPGAGLRIFLLEQLGIGVDINVPFGFLVHRDQRIDESARTNSNFLLGFEILPLIVEFRF